MKKFVLYVAAFFAPEKKVGKSIKKSTKATNLFAQVHSGLEKQNHILHKSIDEAYELMEHYKNIAEAAERQFNDNCTVQDNIVKLMNG